MFRSRLAVFLVVLGASACVTSPRNNDSVASKQSVVTFQGAGLEPLKQVRVEASSSAAGPFVQIPNVGASTSLLPSYNVPMSGGQSLPLYGFTFTTPIPTARWHSLRGQCATAETFVRLREGASTYYRTFEKNMSPNTCIQSKLNAGFPPGEAFEACTSDDSPVIRLTVGGTTTVHVGDVVIDDAADVTALVCVKEIQGSLLVTASAPKAISLPSLERVTGDVELVYTSYIPDPPPMTVPYQAQRCGATHWVTADVRRFNLPLFTEVGGDLTLRQEGSFSGNASTQPIDLHLNALTSVGGDLSIEIFQFGGSPCGLTAVTDLPNDVSLIFHTGEVGSVISGLMPAATEVGGTLTINGGHNSFGNPLGAVTQVGGLSIFKSSGLDGFHFPLLTDVLGQVYLEGVGIGSNPNGLAHVGSLVVVDASYSSLQQVGGPSLIVDSALELNDNGNLSTLLNGGTSKITLAPTASFTLASNPLLPASQICGFVSYEQSIGWSGPSNLGGTTCP
jgi:hypothetical protein